MSTSRKWAVGITTAPRKDSTLLRCVQSVIDNGWTPVVFSEPGTDLTGLPESVSVVQRSEKLGAWHNWHGMCQVLLTQNPEAEAILTIQDDTLFVPRTREFIESQGLWPDLPDNVGFVSLYTPSHYQCRYHVLDGQGRRVGDLPNKQRATVAKARHKDSTIKQVSRSPGCLHVPTQSLWGACALAFPRASLERIIGHKTAQRWRGASGRQKPNETKNVDTAIGKICNALNLKMWFWNPSLSQHVAELSTLGHGGCTGQRAAAYVAKDPFKDCLADMSPHASGLASRGLWWVSNNDLDHIVADLCSRLPADIKAVAGVPRSGLMPAYLVAKHLHIPMVPIESCMGTILKPFRPSVSRPLLNRAGRVLVIDDSVNSGKTWDEIGGRIKVPHYRAAALVTEVGKNRVDYWGAELGNPHLFHWQWLSSTHCKQFIFDMDGVICEDWIGDWAGRDSARYAEFLRSARPLHIPRVPIMAIVTGRQESTRPETEDWLRRHDVRYGSLILNPGGVRHSEFKAQQYEAMGGAICFAESSAKQAADIHRRTGKPVLSVETWEMLGGAGVVLPERVGLAVAS